ncbi:hypothetical protein F4778DRAFT_186888 [Xylariomycetidae sp. FL2044]|nr:hypothetical protein F4778DRAFT_186888 [Xylariomycetidae sp. FL2044]
MPPDVTTAPTGHNEPRRKPTRKTLQINGIPPLGSIYVRQFVRNRTRACKIPERLPKLLALRRLIFYQNYSIANHDPALCQRPLIGGIRIRHYAKCGGRHTIEACYYKEKMDMMFLLGVCRQGLPAFNTKLTLDDFMLPGLAVVIPTLTDKESKKYEDSIERRYGSRYWENSNYDCDYGDSNTLQLNSADIHQKTQNGETDRIMNKYPVRYDPFKQSGWRTNPY